MVKPEGDKVDMEDRKIHEMTLQGLLKKLVNLEAGGGNYITWRERVTDILIFDKSYALVSGAEERPAGLDNDEKVKEWTAKEERARMQLRNAVDDSELHSLMGLNAVEVWEQLESTYGIDDLHSHIGILTTIKTIEAKSSADINEFCKEHDVVLARARATGFPLVVVVNKNTSAADAKKARSLNMIYTWEILTRLPDEPEWETFRRSIKDRSDFDWQPRSLLNLIRKEMLDRAVSNISLDENPILNKSSDAKALATASRRPTTNPPTTPLVRDPCPHCTHPTPNHTPARCYRNKSGVNYRPNLGERKGEGGGGGGGDADTNAKGVVRVVIGGSRVGAVVAASGGGDPKWYLDSCASHHTVHDRGAFEQYEPRRSTTEGFDGTVVKVDGIGTISLKVNVGSRVQEIVVSGVHHCPDSRYNLLSLPRLQKHGVSALFKDDDTFEAYKDGVVIFQGKNSTKDGIAQIFSPSRRSPASVVSAIVASAEERRRIVERAHRLLGHPGQGQMRDLLKAGIPALKGTTTTDLSNFYESPCSSCKEGKMTASRFPTSTRSATRPLELLHSDIAGPFPNRSHGGARYFTFVIDDFTDYVEAEPMVTTKDLVKAVNACIERLKRRFVGQDKPESTTFEHNEFRSDNGPEYRAGKFEEYLKEQGFFHQTSVTYTPQQNGKAERTVRILKEKVSCLLSDARLSDKWWAEALRYAVFAINRLPSSSLSSESPYHHLFQEHDPDLDHLPIFGQTIWVHIKNTPTFAPKAVECRFLSLGTDDGKKAFRVQKLDAKGGDGIFWARDVSFSKREAEMKGSADYEGGDGGEWLSSLLDDDEQPEGEEGSKDDEGAGGGRSGESSEGGISSEKGGAATSAPLLPEVAGDAPALPAGTKKGGAKHSYTYKLLPPEKETTEDLARKYGGGGKTGRTRSGKSTVGAVVPIIGDDDDDLPPLSDGINLVRSSSKIDLAGRPFPSIPSSFDEAMASPFAKEWYDECANEIKGLLLQDAWELVDRPKGAFVVGSKWAFGTKVDKDNNLVRVKGRLCAKGLRKLPFFERFGPRSAPLAPWPSVLIFFVFIALGRLFVRVTDMVKGYVAAPTTLISDEPVYMEQPAGFADPLHPDKVCRLKRALYGLPNSGRALHLLLREKLGQGGLLPIAEDVTIYSGEKEGERVDYLSYVDDGISAGTQPSVEYLIDEMKNAFDIDVRGDLDGAVVLGREISYDREKGIIVVKQRAQILKALEELGIKDPKPTHIPMQPGVEYRKFDGTASEETKEWYLRAVGHINWIATSRPDISFSGGVAARYSSNPGPEHVALVKRIFAYLSTTIDVGLQIGGGRFTGDDIIAFVDSDFAGDKDDSTSTTGYAIFVKGALVSWASRKQKTVTTSTAQAEAAAISAALAESEWVKTITLPLSLSLVDTPITLLNDNSTTVGNLINPTYVESTKNVDARMRAVRQRIEIGEVVVKWIKSANNIADVLTKPLGAKEHRRHAIGMGLVDFPSEEGGAWGSR